MFQLDVSFETFLFLNLFRMRASERRKHPQQNLITTSVFLSGPTMRAVSLLVASGFSIEAVRLLRMPDALESPQNNNTLGFT